MEKLNFEPRLDASNITVSIQGDHDIVVLGGTVDSFAEKLAAEKAVKSLANVRAIANEIEVDLSMGYHKTDVDIAKDVTTVLKSSVFVPSEHIQSVVKDGIVTLSGEVNWQYQKNSAFKVVQNLFGIKSVINKIVVKSSTRIDAHAVKEQITKEFERHAKIDADKVKVTVEGKRIVLTGKVRNFDEIDEAETAAWSVAGVENVNNKLTIDR